MTGVQTCALPISTIGSVQILARDNVRGGHVDVNGLDIIAADARGERERPHGYGVYVINGAFTLWNMQPDERAKSAPTSSESRWDARVPRSAAVVCSSVAPARPAAD